MTEFERLTTMFEETLQDPDLGKDARIALYGFASAFFVLGKITLDEVEQLRELLGLTLDDVEDLPL